MKFALALTAALTYATEAETQCWEGNDCVSWWYTLDHCDYLWWGYDDCYPEDDGWFFADECTSAWMWADEYNENGGDCNDVWDALYPSCYSDWIWEECSYSWYYTDYCDDDCGWWYWDDWSQWEYWVSCDEFATWDWCW